MQTDVKLRASVQSTLTVITQQNGEWTWGMYSASGTSTYTTEQIIRVCCILLLKKSELYKNMWYSNLTGTSKEYEYDMEWIYDMLISKYWHAFVFSFLNVPLTVWTQLLNVVKSDFFFRPSKCNLLFRPRLIGFIQPLYYLSVVHKTNFKNISILIYFFYLPNHFCNLMYFIF